MTTRDDAFAALARLRRDLESSTIRQRTWGEVDADVAIVGAAIAGAPVGVAQTFAYYDPAADEWSDVLYTTPVEAADALYSLRNERGTW